MDDQSKRSALSPAERSAASRARRAERGAPTVPAVDRALRTVIFQRARTSDAIGIDDLIPAVVNLLMADGRLTQRGCLAAVRTLIAQTEG